MLLPCGAGQLPCPQDALEVPVQERERRALQRDVGTRAHGDAHVGGGQGRGVVDPVAGHGHSMTLVLEPLDEPELRFRQQARVDPVDGDSVCHGPGRALVVPRGHDHGEARLPERRDRLRSPRLQGIGDGDEPDETTIAREQHHRLAFGSQVRRGRRERLRIYPLLPEQPFVAEGRGTARDRGGDAAPGDRPEVLGRLPGPVRCSSGSDRLRERVLRWLLQSSGEA